MSKKRLVVLSSGALLALLLVGLVGGTLVFADENDPTIGEPGAHGHWGGFGFGGRSWAVFDTAAEILGLTPDGLFAELHDAGKALTEIAEEQGVDTEALREAMNASRAETMRQRTEEAVANGDLSQEQADWMLEGLDKGFMGGRRGMGMGRRGFGPGCPCVAEQS
jgi:hypothetical protein